MLFACFFLLICLIEKMTHIARAYKHLFRKYCYCLLLCFLYCGYCNRLLVFFVLILFSEISCDFSDNTYKIITDFEYRLNLTPDLNGIWFSNPIFLNAENSAIKIHDACNNFLFCLCFEMCAHVQFMVTDSDISDYSIEIERITTRLTHNKVLWN